MKYFDNILNFHRFTQCCVSVPLEHTLIHTVCDSMMDSLRPTTFRSLPLLLNVCVCALSLTYFQRSMHIAHEKKILQYFHTLLSFLSCSNTPVVFVYALLSSSLFPSIFRAICPLSFLSLLLPSLSFNPPHILRRSKLFSLSPSHSLVSRSPLLRLLMRHLIRY